MHAWVDYNTSGTGEMDDVRLWETRGLQVICKRVWHKNAAVTASSDEMKDASLESQGAAERK